MTKLTKDEVRHFTPEQQVAFASMMAQRVRARQELVERVQRGPALMIFGMVLVLGFASLSVIYPRTIMLAVISVAGLIGYVVAVFNRRIEALMELLDHDSKGAAETEHDEGGPAV